MKSIYFLSLQNNFFVITVCLLVQTFSNTVSAQDKANQSTLENALTSLTVQDGFSVRLIATEPLIKDPVSARLDYRGRLWVVEMGDYPSRSSEDEAPNGRLKVLQDDDHDGIYESSTVFAGGLDFPTGVQPYRNGAIVTLAGKIVFLADQDGDLVSDETTVLFDGFAQGNQQLRANHPTLAPDGYVYVANGLRGGLVQARDPRFKAKAQPLDLRNGDFFFDPEGGQWGLVTGKSQFGLTIDDFGRRLGCSNRNPAMHAAFDTSILRRDPLLTPPELVVDVALTGEQSAVYPRGRAWTTSNLHSGQFSAACGVFAPGWSSQDREYLFVCEPTAYLIQRQLLKRVGSRWSSRREETTHDFVTSDNEWFRPVDLTAGPDQSMFVVDMARAVIEHPDFMPPELKNRPDQRDGTSLGRIWQVVEGNCWPESAGEIDLEKAPAWMSSDSAWRRNSATQFFLEKGPKHADLWGRMILDSNTQPCGKSRAAFLLNYFGQLTDEHILHLIDSKHGRLRALALQLINSRGGWASIVPDLQDESCPEVLLAYADSVITDSDLDSKVRLDVLTKIAGSASADENVLRMVGTVSLREMEPLYSALLKQDRLDQALLQHFLQRMAISEPLQSSVMLANYLRQRDQLQGSSKAQLLSLLIAWNKGLIRGRHSLKALLAESLESNQKAFQDAWEVIEGVVTDSETSPNLQAEGLRLLIAVDWFDVESLRNLASSKMVSNIRAVSLRRLLQIDTEWTREYLSDRWLALQPQLRQEMIQASTYRADDALWILHEVEQGRLPRNAVDPKASEKLRQDRNKTVAALAQELLAPDRDRYKVISKYQSEMINQGDPILGRKLFSTHCSACHRIDGVGTNVGPDISDTRTKSADYLLVAILDPNAAIDSAFVQTQILTTDGTRCDGLLITEDSECFKIQQPGGETRVIPKSEIDRVKTPGVSLMPVGFEKTINVKDMGDLIAYLKNWRYLKVSIPGVSEAARH